jgi:hypothetical protein
MKKEVVVAVFMFVVWVPGLATADTPVTARQILDTAAETTSFRMTSKRLTIASLALPQASPWIAMDSPSRAPVPALQSGGIDPRRVPRLDARFLFP